jgi:hypothetical protein
MAPPAVKLAILLLLAGLCPVHAQETQKAEIPQTSAAKSSVPVVPPSVEDMLQQALSNNPQIKQAESAVALAEANLKEVRMRVTQEVVAIHGELSRMKSHRKEVETKIEKRLASRDELADLDSKMAELEAKARYITGKGLKIFNREVKLEEFQHTELHETDSPGARPAPPESLRSFLEAPIDLQFDDRPISNCLEFISTYYAINIVVDPSMPIDNISVKLQNVPLRQALQALVDQSDYLCFVLRDYGILATVRDKAERINAATIPEDVPLYVRRSAGAHHGFHAVDPNTRVSETARYHASTAPAPVQSSTKGMYTKEFVETHDADYFFERIAMPDPGYHQFSGLWAVTLKGLGKPAEERNAIVERALTIAEDTHAAFNERFQCVYAASHFELPASIPRIAKLLMQDEDAQLRCVAACALGHFESEEAKAALKQALGSEKDAATARWIQRAIAGEIARPAVPSYGTGPNSPIVN